MYILRLAYARKQKSKEISKMLFVRNSNEITNKANSSIAPQFFTGDCKSGGGN